MARAIQKQFVALGFADLYVGDEDETAPADTLGFNGAFTGFTSVGATEEGVTLTYGREIQEHRVEEDPLPAITTVQTATFTIATSLAEDTVDTLSLAYGADLEPGAVDEPTRIRFSLDVKTISILFEAPLPDGGFRRLYIPRANAVGEVETAYRRSEAKRLYPITIQSVCGIDEIDLADFPLDATP